MKLSPFFVVMFAFCFAVTFNTIWEIYEFTVDTMKDIIVDVIGALVAAITGYFSIKSDRLWFRPHLIEDEEK